MNGTSQRLVVTATLVILVCSLAGLLALGPSRASAQGTYPSRALEFVIPFPPAGPADTAARIVQPKLSSLLGVPIVLVNKAGGGALGADHAAKAKPDGYTVFASPNAPLTTVMATQPDLPYRRSSMTP